ncbi:putative bifunctional diguanylate cyclase/phosphodiesterase [Saccharothrix australiensis]|uniref:PAS domain S-box-containing protein/diguanylate cyclase (GGDEF)-like protein n=1 Tax=Saccharothrix australiensis TaxID=2072 RepID=A0A495W6F2_9PSEU|nr:diguanylate cyclase [Saccharothrix australiensis]RKT57301.1 PAS domain S-box-containing protein/diguanylate cyclase (GGDEF)-like protein [Saccharothrix australiensis]
MADPERTPGRAPSTPDAVRDRELLARKWAYLMSGRIVVAHTQERLDAELRARLDAICEELHREPPEPERLVRLGEELGSLGYVGEDALRCTSDVLGPGLLALPEFRSAERAAERVVVGLGALASGLLAANRRAVFEQQESMQLTLLKAVRDAKWRLRESEARFDEVVTSSTSGVLIVDLNGRVLRANAAIGEIRGRTAAELADRSLFDLVHPDSAPALREAMARLLDGGQERVRQSQRLLRRDGDVARISLTTSLLRDADDRPAHFVTVVEDGTELMLLQGELHRQALHDVLTGLPNRQYFGTHLETALRRADPEHGVTLFHLDLDAFRMVCNSLGARAGERLLVHVAQRLRGVLARERAMVARFEGDEFGILVENTATTPDVARTVAAINAELAEPVFVDGHGLAVSASIGVVRRPALDLPPEELLRAADQALRRAQAGRRGQWELFHPEQDEADRRAQALAVGMPGAWEHGEIGVRYRPVVRFGGGLAGVAALLHWDREEPLGHDECVALAEQTGLVLPLGEWLLRVAGGQARWWRGRGGVDAPVAVDLSAVQSGDADLVSRVVRALDDTGLRPDRLEVGMPAAVRSVAEAVDNLAVLADMGVRTALHDFGLGPDDVAAVEGLPVRVVRVARRLVDHRAPYVEPLLAAVRAAGATIVVDGVRTAAQADWWRAAGADAGRGDFFGAACPPADVAAFFG